MEYGGYARGIADIAFLAAASEYNDLVGSRRISAFGIMGSIAFDDWMCPHLVGGAFEGMEKTSA